MAEETIKEMQNVRQQMLETFGSGSETHYRYVTKSDLRRLNNHAIEFNLNRSLKPDFVETVEEKFSDGSEIKYALTNKLLHNDKEWRCWFPVLVNDQLTEVFLDISFVEFEALPTVEMITTQPELNS